MSSTDRPDSDSALPQATTQLSSIVHLGTGGPSPVKRANIPRAELPQGTPRRGQGPARTHESRRGITLSSDSDRPTPGLPGSQSNAAAARRHGSRSREAKSQECVDTHGASSQDDPARTPPSWNCLNRSTRLIDTGWRLPPFVLGRVQDPSDASPQRGAALRTALPWRCPLGSDTDLSSTAQLVSLR